MTNIIKGDFNAKIGKREPINLGVEQTLRTETESNKNGSKLINFLNKHNLKIVNTFYYKKQNKTWTWRSPDRLIKNEIDHLLIDKMYIIKDMQVISGFQFSSDHRPILCKLKPVSPHSRSKKVNQDQAFSN